MARKSPPPGRFVLGPDAIFSEHGPRDIPSSTRSFLIMALNSLTPPRSAPYHPQTRCHRRAKPTKQHCDARLTARRGKLNRASPVRVSSLNCLKIPDPTLETSSLGAPAPSGWAALRPAASPLSARHPNAFAATYLNAPRLLPILPRRSDDSCAPISNRRSRAPQLALPRAQPLCLRCRASRTRTG